MRGSWMLALGALCTLAGGAASAQQRQQKRGQRSAGASPKPLVCLLPYVEQENLRYAGPLTRLTGRLLSQSDAARSRSLPLTSWGASEIDLKAMVRQNKSLAPLAAKAGKTARADYVLFGSLRKRGDALVEVSSYLLPVRPGGTAARGSAPGGVLTQRFTVRISKDPKAMHRQAEEGMKKSLKAFVEQERARRG